MRSTGPEATNAAGFPGDVFALFLPVCLLGEEDTIVFRNGTRGLLAERSWLIGAFSASFLCLKTSLRWQGRANLGMTL